MSNEYYDQCNLNTCINILGKSVTKKNKKIKNTSNMAERKFEEQWDGGPFWQAKRVYKPGSCIVSVKDRWQQHQRIINHGALLIPSNDDCFFWNSNEMENGKNNHWGNKATALLETTKPLLLIIDNNDRIILKGTCQGNKRFGIDQTWFWMELLC